MVVWRTLTEEVLVVVEVVMATVVEADVSGRTVVCDDFQKKSKSLNTNDCKYILNKTKGYGPCR